jgi:citrate lyase subunit beta/citryl-CoA lyase
MRSKLFVPGARPDFFDKALRSEADALSFDLEDAVPEDGKAAARARLAEFLGSDAVRSSPKTIIVRINAQATAHFDADVRALAGAPVHLINIPKVEEPGTLAHAAEAVRQVRPDARLLANVETGKGVGRAAAIAAAHPLVAGLQAGLNDLFGSLQIDRSDPANVRAALWQVRLAAAEAGVFAYDGAWPDLDDPEGFRREAEMARAMGYLGKSCIHPRQVTLANSVFDRRADVGEARRIVEAARAAAASGRGAFLLDGRMIDAPAIARAEAVLAGSGDGR